MMSRPLSRPEISFALLAAVAATGLVTTPHGPGHFFLCVPPDMAFRLRVASFAALALVALAAAAWRAGREGRALRTLTLAAPYLLIRSKWALVLGVGAVLVAAGDALGRDRFGGRPPRRYGLRVAAASLATTVAWILYLGREGVYRRMPSTPYRFPDEAVGPYYLVCGGAAALCLIVALHFLARACAEPEPDLSTGGRVLELAAIIGATLLAVFT